MGKQKPPRRSASTSGATAPSGDARPLPPEMLPLPPLLVAALAEGPAPTGPSKEPRLWMAPELMHAAGLGSGDVVTVAVATAPAVVPTSSAWPAASPGAPPLPLLSPTSPAAASPMRVAPSLPPAATLTPASLWQAAGERFNVQLPAGLSVPSPTAVGEFLVPCSAWPAPRLPAGSAALSPALASSLLRPPSGALLLVYLRGSRLPEGGAGEVPSAGVGNQAAGTEAGVISLEVCMARDGALPANLPGPSKGPTQQAAAPQASPRTPAKSGGTPSKSAAATPGRAAARADYSTAGLAEALAAGGRRQQQMLETLLRCQLQGCWLLPGNPVAVPLLGAECLLHVAAIDGVATGSRAMRVGAGSRCCLQPSADSRGALGTLAGGGALASGDRGSAAVEGAVAAAREAAREAGVSEEAACRAAEASASAGLAGGGVDFRSLGGVREQMDAIRRVVTLPLRRPELLKSYGVPAPGGLLLHGPPGTGKTLLARAAAADAGAALFVVNGPDVVSEFYGESEAGLLGVWAAAKAAAPSIIFLDEVDAIAGGREAGASSGRLVTSLLQLMDRGGRHESATSGGGSHDDGDAARVVVLAASNRPEALDPALRRPGRFDCELEVGVPTPAGRREILQVRLKGVRHSLSEEQVRKIADSAHGYVGADVAALVNDAALNALRRLVRAPPTSCVARPLRCHFPGKLCHATSHTVALRRQWQDVAIPPKGEAPPDAQAEVTAADFELAQTHITPSAMREVALEVPRVRWGDIGGQEGVKQSLKEAVEWPFQHGDALRRLGATPPAGVLLYGPPGCSKTLLARACACEAGLNFLAIKGPELYSKWVGESEKAVAALFQRARAAAPAIVFFDEIDGLAAPRQDGGAAGGGAPSVEERVLSQLLSEMDGLVGRQGVIVVAATNRPDCVDAALLRPGRFDRLVYVPPPDRAAREAIFAVHLRGTPVAADVSLGELAERTEHYTGADIAGVCREAALAALEEDIGAAAVRGAHFVAALAGVAPSGPLPWADAAMYGRFARAHGDTP
eukprot:jgi/Tetstr1/428526/TSEL_001856.t1